MAVFFQSAVRKTHSGIENMAVLWFTCWNTLNKRSHPFRNLQLKLPGILCRKEWHSFRLFFFNLLWLRVSGTPPKNNRKGKNQNSIKWNGEKRNTHKTISPNQLSKPITVFEQQKNCAGGWDLIMFKKTCLNKESRENKRAQHCVRSSICCSWVYACCRHWGLQTGMMDEGICHTQGLVLSVPVPVPARRSSTFMVIQTNDNKLQWDTSSLELHQRERVTKDLTREPGFKKNLGFQI